MTSAPLPAWAYAFGASRRHLSRETRAEAAFASGEHPPAHDTQQARGEVSRMPAASFGVAVYKDAVAAGLRPIRPRERRVRSLEQLWGGMGRARELPMMR